jgi:hypothetical protein
MIPNHLTLKLNSHSILRLTGIVVALLALLASVAFVSAQSGDTPIVIGDGSLTMQSAVPWARFTGKGNTRTHPQSAKSVTSVDISMPALGHTVTFTGDQVEVDIMYAGSFPIKVTSGPGGRNAVVNTDFASFHPGSDGTQLIHNNSTGMITHVAVLRNGTSVFDSAGTGHTKIVIHYE